MNCWDSRTSSIAWRISPFIVRYCAFRSSSGIFVGFPLDTGFHRGSSDSQRRLRHIGKQAVIFVIQGEDPELDHLGRDELEKLGEGRSEERRVGKECRS